MSPRILLLTLLVSVSVAFSPVPSGLSVSRLVGAGQCYSPLLLPQQQQQRYRLSPCHVQISLDDSPSTISEFAFPESTVRDAVSMQKVLNGTFLALCFGFALYHIFTIDHGMTRGWTQSEIAMRIPLDNWSSYESALLEKPISTKTAINTIIYLLGDWLSQTVFQGKNVLDFDISRTLKNGLIGFCFGPLVHQYYEFSDAILPVEGGLANRASKIVMDQTIYLTVKCSVYISAVGLLGGDDWKTVQANVKERIGPVVITAWKFWPLVHCITYGLIPARHRILWVNCVDLVWNAILASKAQGDNEEEEPVVCTEDEQLIESIETKQVFDANIQAELLEILPSPPSPEIMLDDNEMDTSSTNCTDAIVETA